VHAWRPRRLGRWSDCGTATCCFGIGRCWHRASHASMPRDALAIRRLVLQLAALPRLCHFGAHAQQAWYTMEARGSHLESPARVMMRHITHTTPQTRERCIKMRDAYTSPTRTHPHKQSPRPVQTLTNRDSVTNYSRLDPRPKTAQVSQVPPIKRQVSPIENATDFATNLDRPRIKCIGLECRFGIQSHRLSLFAPLFLAQCCTVFAFRRSVYGFGQTPEMGGL